MESHDFEQRLVEVIADEVASIATEQFKGSLAEVGGVVFDVPESGEVKLIAVDHYAVGGLILQVESQDGNRYFVRFEISSGHYAFEAVPLDA